MCLVYFYFLGGGYPPKTNFLPLPFHSFLLIREKTGTILYKKKFLLHDTTRGVCVCVAAVVVAVAVILFPVKESKSVFGMYY